MEDMPDPRWGYDHAGRRQTTLTPGNEHTVHKLKRLAMFGGRGLTGYPIEVILVGNEEMKEKQPSQEPPLCGSSPGGVVVVHGCAVVRACCCIRRFRNDLVFYLVWASIFLCCHL